MKILQICNKSPYPPKEGGSIAMNSVTEGLLKANCIVKVLAVNTPKFSVDVSELPSEYVKSTSFAVGFIDTNVKLLPALKCFLKGKSYHVERFISEQFSKILEGVLLNDKFDVIQLETVYMAPYIEQIRLLSPQSAIVIRAHNVEHLIWQRIAKKNKNPLLKLYLKQLAASLEKFELSVIQECDGIAAISDIDRDFFSESVQNVPVVTIPFGLNSSYFSYVNTVNRKLSLFHLGSMDWMPNVEGIKWFLSDVWPVLSQKYDNLTFELAGRNMPHWIYNCRQKNVVVHGEVDDAAKYMAERTIMIVPVFSGSGVRIKIIEGMAAGNIIVSTPIGAEGINCSNGENILIAENSSDFVETISQCIENTQKMNMISENARKFAFDNYSIDSTSAKLIGFYNQIIANKKGKN